MKKIFQSIFALALGLSFAQCSDYLEVSSPSNTNDTFVTSNPTETFKALSWAYAEYRGNAAAGGNYNYGDPCGSDVEYYPESNSANNIIAMLLPEIEVITAKQTQFNSLYKSLSRAARVAEIIAAKPEYQNDLASGEVTDWTQLYGEAITMRAFFYFELTRHFGDVPYGIENTTAEEYTLTSRFTIFDNLIEDLKRVEGQMWDLGSGSISNPERISRTYANALIGEIALYAGGWQTIRTDVEGLYGDVQFETQGTEANGCVYARRTNYLDYYRIAEEYFDHALGDRKGTSALITSDSRGYANNPFQLYYQAFADKTYSSESIFEIGNVIPQPGELTYSQGRPSNGGGNNAAPCKAFGAIRIIPTFYYTGFEDGDKRRDVSMTVTGSNGDGNEAILSFQPGSKLLGGISNNKWDENRMPMPYYQAQRNAGYNYPILGVANLILMQAEVKAMLGKDADALSLVNQIRRRAFGNDNHDLNSSGEQLLDDIWTERKRELIASGDIRWDMIRSGKFAERALKVRQEMKDMIAGLEANGYYTFANGKTIPNYIWTKLVEREETLTYDADPNDPTNFPGWRGQFDYSTIADLNGKVTGTAHNLAIQGLFEYIDPEGSEAKALEADGYKKVDWGITIVQYKNDIYDRNILSGIGDGTTAPRYYHPIPFEVLNQSKGNVTNGYGLPQQ